MTCAADSGVTLMKHAAKLTLFGLSLLSGWCAGYEPVPKVHTYADMEAEITRNATRYNESQLLQHPEQTFDDTELVSSHFYQLPLSERVVYVMASFAQVKLDGEEAERMEVFLTYRNDPHFLSSLPPRLTKNDEAYA